MSNRRLELWVAETGLKLGEVNPWLSGYPGWVTAQLAGFRREHAMVTEAPLGHRHDEVTDWIERRVKSALIDQLLEVIA